MIISGSLLSAPELPLSFAPTSQQRERTKTDIVVAGGGLAGVCAAVAAARNGARVTLVQNRSRLGGNSSSEIRMHVCGANHSKNLALWRETGLIEEFKLTDAATNPQRSFEMWDLLLYDRVVSEPNITLLLDTHVVDARVARGRIKSVTAISPLMEAAWEIEAAFFIDCTGDSTLAHVAEADIMRGREARAQFGESLAPESADLKTMGNSLLFFARPHDGPMPFRAPAWARRFTEDDFRHRAIRSWEYGYWWIEWGGELDTIADNARIRHELLRVLFGVWDYIKNSGKHPDSANWALEWVGMVPGKRENRRILGEHVMTQTELERAEQYPDRVAYGGWPMDDHPPGGIDAGSEQPCRQIHFKRPYNIPLRSLYSRNRPNLLMAGRNISASHVAFSSTRVMATCSTMGQAAGTAASFCLREKCLPRDVVKNVSLLNRLQQCLLKDDQALLDVVNADDADHARAASITATAETADGKAANVIDGINRDIGDGRCHQWQAALPEPALTLAWDTPRTISSVYIIFDTGLHRRLFLSGEFSTYNGQVRGPQPETVADYMIEAQANGQWQTLAEVKDNFLRHVCHTFQPQATQALRVTVHRTNSDALARVFEIRCY
jgi:hypothetical protein